ASATQRFAWATNPAAALSRPRRAGPTSRPACPAWAAGVDQPRPHRPRPLDSSVDLHSYPLHATASCAPGPVAAPSLGRTRPWPGHATTPLALQSSTRGVSDV